MNPIRTEPALLLGVVNAALAALVIPDTWAKLVMAAAALIVSAVTRSRVSPTVAE